jgi:putative transposase
MEFVALECVAWHAAFAFLFFELRGEPPFWSALLGTPLLLFCFFLLQAVTESESMRDRRVDLIERLCHLPEAALPELEAIFDRLERATRSDDPNQTCQTATDATKDWPHAPMHRLSEQGTFIVTPSTMDKRHFFRDRELLELLETRLLTLARQHDVVLEAWAVFSNHYHFVAHTSGGQNQLGELIERLHFATAAAVNKRDGQPNRAVWFNFWETQLTYAKSYLARLNYVHQNAVKHRLVKRASDYPWCSAAWFERSATPAQMKTIYGIRIDRVHVEDDFEPVL